MRRGAAWFTGVSLVLASGLYLPASAFGPAPADTAPRSGWTLTSRCQSPGSADPRSGPESERRALHLLTDVRAGAHRCFDRAVFEFRPADGEAPGALGYDVAYRDPPFREPGSGRHVDVEGDAFIVVRFHPARDVELSAGQMEPTYDGPASVRPEGGNRIVEVRHAGSFEGVVTWIIGLDRKRPFSLDVPAARPRLVIDVG